MRRCLHASLQAEIGLIDHTKALTFRTMENNAFRRREPSLPGGLQRQGHGQSSVRSAAGRLRDNAAIAHRLEHYRAIGEKKLEVTVERMGVVRVSALRRERGILMAGAAENSKKQPRGMPIAPGQLAKSELGRLALSPADP